MLLNDVTWQLAPGERAGLVGVNGSGKTSFLRLLDGSLVPARPGAANSAGPPGPAAIRAEGTVIRGKTVRIAHLSQELSELDPGRRVLETVQDVRSFVRVGKRELSASQILERFGFRGDKQWTPVGELSGGERRRLQLLRLLMDEPNVLLLDEPTNDLDIETLTELEDLLDGWPGSMTVVSHDRYFLERVTDHVVALLGDGKLSFLAGGVEEYLDRVRGTREAALPGSAAAAPGPPSRHPPGRPLARPGSGPRARSFSDLNGRLTACPAARRSLARRWPITPATTRSSLGWVPTCAPSRRRRRPSKNAGSALPRTWRREGMTGRVLLFRRRSRSRSPVTRCRW